MENAFKILLNKSTESETGKLFLTSILFYITISEKVKKIMLILFLFDLYED